MISFLLILLLFLLALQHFRRSEDGIFSSLDTDGGGGDVILPDVLSADGGEDAGYLVVREHVADHIDLRHLLETELTLDYRVLLTVDVVVVPKMVRVVPHWNIAEPTSPGWLRGEHLERREDGWVEVTPSAQRTQNCSALLVTNLF